MIMKIQLHTAKSRKGKQIFSGNIRLQDHKGAMTTNG